MELREITDVEQFEPYFLQEGLATDDEKIKHLKNVMKIKGTRYEYDVTEKEKLIGLQEAVLFGHWKAIAAAQEREVKARV
jgi:hypothetical protein